MSFIRFLFIGFYPPTLGRQLGSSDLFFGILMGVMVFLIFIRSAAHHLFIFTFFVGATTIVSAEPVNVFTRVQDNATFWLETENNLGRVVQNGSVSFADSIPCPFCGIRTPTEIQPLAANSAFYTPSQVLNAASLPERWYFVFICNACIGHPATETIRFDFPPRIDGAGQHQFNNPSFHFHNTDSSDVQFAPTTQSGGAPVSLTHLSGNNEFEVAGTIANSTQNFATFLGCESNAGANPNGGCGTVQLNGNYDNVDITLTDQLNGDGLNIAISTTAEFDFGDAPDPTGGTGTNNYQTRFLDGGAAHVRRVSTTTLNPTVHLGTTIGDLDPTTQQNTTATADGADEDGVTLPTFTNGQTVFIPVSITGSGRFSGFVDWNQDGDFVDANEQIANNIAVNAAYTGLSVNVPAGALTGTTFTRFRVCTQSNNCNTSTGIALDGEVEDHLANVALPVDRSDAPSSYGDVSHTIVSGIYLGNNAPDADSVSGASPFADNDDNDGNDDEDGVSFTLSADTISATVTGFNSLGETAMLCGYLDGAANGVLNNSFDRAVTYTAANVGLSDPLITGNNEELCIQVINSHSLNLVGGGANDANANCSVSGSNFTCTLNWDISFTANTTTFARFRLTTDAAFFSTSSPSPIVAANDGEIEDYQINIEPTVSVVDKFELKTVTPKDFLTTLGVYDKDTDQLRDLLSAWGQDAKDLTGRAVLIQALIDYLDPNGDGVVAVLLWGTLSERGTIGFYVERQERAEDEGAGKIPWVGINDQLLPGLITAPMGGEYILVDPSARPGISYRYRLIEHDAWRKRHIYGPYELQMNQP